MKKFLIITGGSSGIGFAAAKLFHDNGFVVINLSRSKINLEAAIHIEVDLSKSNWHKSLDSNFKDQLSSADQVCLVHNASKMQSDNVESIDLNNLREVLEVNLVGPSILNKITIPYINIFCENRSTNRQQERVAPSKPPRNAWAPFQNFDKKLKFHDNYYPYFS